MSSRERPRGLPFLLGLASSVGVAAGALVSAGLLALGVMQLGGAGGAAMHYGLATGLALVLGCGGRWSPGAHPRLAAVAVALLVTFALRRWLDVWVNLEPLGWRSGTAGLAPAVVFPLLGLLLGVIFAVDAARSPR